MNPQQLLEEIIVPSCQIIGLYSEDVATLLLATAAVESECGEYVQQLDGGPALGIYQMEPRTLIDLAKNYLAFNPKYKNQVSELMNFDKIHVPYQLSVRGNMVLATILARLQYRRFPEAIPNRWDMEGQWKLYKKRWNSELGKTTYEGFRDCWETYVEPELTRGDIREELEVA